MAGTTEIKPQILVIDDEVDIAELIAEQLEFNYTVSIANSIQSGVSKLKEQSFDLIVTDLHLPDCRPQTSSVAMLRESTKHVPILLITGQDENDPGVKKAIADGATGLIVKPFTLDSLESSIAHTLASKQAS